MRSINKALIAASIMGAAVTSPAHAFLQNWYFDVDAGGAVAAQRISDNIGIDGSSTGQVTLTALGGDSYNFQEIGAMSFTKPNQGGSHNFSNDGWEFTAVYNLTGAGTFSSGVANFTGGTVDMYVQQIGSAGFTSFGDVNALDTFLFGANDGIKIASFDVFGNKISSLNEIGLPVATNNAKFEVTGKATFMLQDYFFKDSTLTTDIADIVSSPDGLVFGFVIGNATLLDPADSLTQNEFISISGQAVNYPDTDFPSAQSPQLSFLVNHGGQARLQVPEPATLALFGIGLVGMGFSSRKRKA